MKTTSKLSRIFLNATYPFSSGCLQIQNNLLDALQSFGRSPFSFPVRQQEKIGFNLNICTDVHLHLIYTGISRCDSVDIKLRVKKSKHNCSRDVTMTLVT